MSGIGESQSRKALNATIAAVPRSARYRSMIMLRAAAPAVDVGVDQGGKRFGQRATFQGCCAEIEHRPPGLF